MVEQVAAQRLVVAGNNGVGWLAGALDVPLVALERNALLVEYQFAPCGVRSLVETIDEPRADRVVRAVQSHLKCVVGLPAEGDQLVGRRAERACLVGRQAERERLT